MCAYRSKEDRGKWRARGPKEGSPRKGDLCSVAGVECIAAAAAASSPCSRRLLERSLPSSLSRRLWQKPTPVGLEEHWTGPDRCCTVILRNHPVQGLFSGVFVPVGTQRRRMNDGSLSCGLVDPHRTSDGRLSLALLDVFVRLLLFGLRLQQWLLLLRRLH